MEAHCIIDRTVGQLFFCDAAGGCTVGRDARIGMNAVVMDEADVGIGSFVAASSFVAAGMKIPAATLAAGVPAKIRRH